MLKLKPMACAICGPGPTEVKFEAALPNPDALDFSARHPPARMHCRVVRCRQCGLVFSDPYFAEDVIRQLYTRAGYINEPQLENMARDYFAELMQSLSGLSKNVHILEVGCGHGFFLKVLHDAGFTNYVGIEPGADAIRLAPPEVRPRIRNEFFDAAAFEPASFDLICCFQVFDHVLDPNAVVGGFAALLRPGGHVFAINHNIRALSARALGERSPMYDIEHVYLFDKDTIRRLFGKHGFAVTRSANIANSYTLGYFVKMLPLPAPTKRLIQKFVQALGPDSWRIRLWGGNMVTVAERP